MVDEWGRISKDQEEPVDNLITWVFEEGTFKPAAKITKDKAYSIITDYLGTPKEAYDWWANKVWAIELEAYGKVKSCEGWLGTPAEESFIPFRFQGQYHDLETGLYYNRFRYYSPEEGMYVTAQDPIRLEGGDSLYGYVRNPNGLVDVLGLSDRFPSWMPTRQAYQRQHIIPYSLRNHDIFVRSGLGINGATNMMYLPMFDGIDPNPNRSLHNGWNLQHQEYNRLMEQELDNIRELADRNNWNDNTIQQRVRQLQHDTRRNLNNGTIRCG